MGNKQSILEDIQIYKPPHQDLVLKDPGNQFKIYQHQYEKYELMANKVTLHDQRQLPLLIQNFKARYQHHYLVSTVYLACQDYSTCGGYFQAVVFYQRLFTNLSKIKDIPFPDVLHFYAVAFKGFQILYQRFGYFEIYEQMFHFGQDSKLKIWCNKDISKNQPQPYLLDKNGTEQDMIRKIIFIIGQNTDAHTDTLNIRDRLLAYGVRNFQMAGQAFRQLCRQFSLSVPEKVQCMASLPSEDVQVMLDLYTSAYKLAQNTQVLDFLTSPNNPIPYPNNHMPNKPYFNTSQVYHAPININQQFAVNQRQINVPNLNLSSLQNVGSEQNQNTIIHTFNQRPQIPSTQNKRGVNLSLGHTINNQVNHVPIDLRNKCLPSRNMRNQASYNNRSNSLQRRPQIKINFGNHSKPIGTNYNSNLNISQRFNKNLQPQINRRQHLTPKPQPLVRNNYLYQPNRPNKVPQYVSRINYVPRAQERYYSQPHFNPNKVPEVFYSPPIRIIAPKGDNSEGTSRILRKSNMNVDSCDTNAHKPVSPNANIHTFDQNKPSHYQTRQKINLSKHIKNTIKIHQPSHNEISKFLNYPSKAQQEPIITRNSSTPTLNQNAQYYKQSSLVIGEKRQNNKHGTHLNLVGNNLNVQVDQGFGVQFNAHSASSRYLQSNRKLQDNVTDFVYKKQYPHKNINRLFDTKIHQLQSFNQSKFGTQNSLKQQNSRVLQILGRQQKDLITSAFADEQIFNRYDQSSKSYLKLQNQYKSGDSFTDPKILEMLKKTSSNALKNQVSNLKKVSKTFKQVQYSKQTIKRPTINQEVEQGILKLGNDWQFRQKKQNNNQKNNLIQFQGFPSLSEISQINRNDENSFSDQKANMTLNDTKNLSIKSRYSQQKKCIKKQDNNFGELYQFQYQGPSYDYSFSSKRQVPMQDNEWKAEYGVRSSIKEQPRSTLYKTNQPRGGASKPCNNLMSFSSNESLASLQFQLSKKQYQILNARDSLKQPINSTDYNFPNTSNRKYNPIMDPEITRDLQRYRKQKHQFVKYI